MPLWWLWPSVLLTFSWRRIQVCQGPAGSSATGDSWICRDGLSPSHFRSSGTNRSWECCSFPFAEVKHPGFSSWWNMEGSLDRRILIPDLFQTERVGRPFQKSSPASCPSPPGDCSSLLGPAAPSSRQSVLWAGTGTAAPDAGCSRSTAEAALPAEGIGLEILSPCVFQCWG